MNIRLFGQIGLILLCIFWIANLFATYAVGDTPWIFPDNANLVIHEAGHVLFRPFGDFMYFLGGSLTQVLVPTIFMVSFLRQAQPFAAAYSLFWIGDTLMNVSYYAGDAQTQALQLTSDDAIHDWHWILNTLNMLPADHIVASILHTAAVIACLSGIAWMSKITYSEVYNRVTPLGTP